MTEIQQTWKKYDLGLSHETYYDLDELICILHQMDAIMMGWGMDFTVELVEDPGETVKVWTWNKS